jgi:hypothetical protein
MAPLGILAATAVAGTGSTASAPGAAVGCRIDVARSGGGIALSAVVVSPRALTGSYRLRVSKTGGGGSADIDQSGDFSTSGGQRVVSGVTLGGTGRFVARLSVDADGRRSDCTEVIGGAT